jgi:hypothetical protein
MQRTAIVKGLYGLVMLLCLHNSGSMFIHVPSFDGYLLAPILLAIFLAHLISSFVCRILWAIVVSEQHYENGRDGDFLRIISYPCTWIGIPGPPQIK